MLDEMDVDSIGAISMRKSDSDAEEDDETNPEHRVGLDFSSVDVVEVVVKSRELP